MTLSVVQLNKKQRNIAKLDQKTLRPESPRLKAPATQLQDTLRPSLLLLLATQKYFTAEYICRCPIGDTVVHNLALVTVPLRKSIRKIDDSSNGSIWLWCWHGKGRNGQDAAPYRMGAAVENGTKIATM